MKTSRLLVACLAFVACVAQEPSIAQFKGLIKRLRPLHSRLSAPQPGDWLAVYPEPGQSFDQYRRCKPVLPTSERRKLYVQPIGTFSPQQQKILDLTVEFMGIYLCLPVEKQPVIPESAIPSKARRKLQGGTQFLSHWILDDLLLPGLPKDAAARIALTATDLWPGKGWNFVFGQASTGDRVGVWSIQRFGDPAQNERAFKLCLIRALGTAVHESCHMFTLMHCRAYACCMGGSNTLEEGDRHPLWLCPECLAKLCWAMKADPVARFEALKSFCMRNGLKAEADFYGRSLKKLGKTAKV